MKMSEEEVVTKVAIFISMHCIIIRIIIKFSSCVHHKNTYIQHLAVLSHNKNEHIIALAVKKPRSVQNSLFNSADELTNESILKNKSTHYRAQSSK